MVIGIFELLTYKWLLALFGEYAFLFVIIMFLILAIAILVRSL